MSRSLFLAGILSLLAPGIPRAFAKPPSVTITEVSRQEGGLKLRWQGSNPGLQFTVESRDSLGTGNWAPAPGGAWPAQTNQFLDTRPEASGRFYRIAFEPVPADLGKLLTNQLVSALSKELIQFVFLQAGYPLTAEKDVRVYKLIYETVDAQGLRTTASGALALPVGVSTPIPLASYQHGTILEREDVPSRLNNEGLIGVAFATAGYAAVVPDFLGLGDSPGFHPYHHAPSEASCVIDLLRAGREYCASNGIALNDRLFLAGYSQGGHATLAALREMETRHAGEFTVTACAAGAGAYDLSGTTFNAVLQGTPVPNPYYTPYLLAAYVDVYGFTNSLADLLASPWRTTVPPLFDGQTGSGVINAALPTIPLTALDPDFVTAVQSQPDHPLRVALRDNDLYDWTPQTPLRLYHCSGDRDVLPMNSRVAFDRFESRGAPEVELFDPSPGSDHTDCVQPTLLDVKAWFDSLR